MHCRLSSCILTGSTSLYTGLRSLPNTCEQSATLTSTYLKNRKEKIKLNHSRRYSLLDTKDRTDFIKEFVALLRFVAAGEANVGFLRKDGVEIHRTADGDGAVEEDEQVLRPPQEEMEEIEESSWRARLQQNREEYTS